MGTDALRPIFEEIDVPGGRRLSREGHRSYRVLGDDEISTWMVEDEAEDPSYVHLTVVRDVEDLEDDDRIYIGSVEEARSIAAALNRICDEITGRDTQGA